MSFYLTDRMKQIIERAEIEANGILQPVHLFISCLQEKSGAFGEIVLKTSIDIQTLRQSIKPSNESIQFEFFKTPVTNEVINIFDTAVSYMKKYNQIYLNEGHFLKAVLLSSGMNGLLTDEDKNMILTLGTTSRDMITHLGNYSFPSLRTYNIRKVEHIEYDKLQQFVELHFSKVWADTIRSGLMKNVPSIYIALDHEHEIIGFAAFDVFQNKKCYFGPMGVAQTNRIKGVGYALLHHCLRDMKDIGYEYAIIGGAGPIEFYEKACNAVVIPERISL